MPYGGYNNQGPWGPNSGASRFTQGLGQLIGTIAGNYIKKPQEEKRVVLNQFQDALQEAKTLGDPTRIWALEDNHPETAEEFSRLTGHQIPQRPMPQPMFGMETAPAPWEESSSPIPMEYKTKTAPVGMPTAPGEFAIRKGIETEKEAKALQAKDRPLITPEQQEKHDLYKNIMQGVPAAEIPNIYNNLPDELKPELFPATFDTEDKSPNVYARIAFAENFADATPEQWKVFEETGSTAGVKYRKLLNPGGLTDLDDIKKFSELWPDATPEEFFMARTQGVYPQRMPQPSDSKPRMSMDTFVEYFGPDYAETYALTGTIHPNARIQRQGNQVDLSVEEYRSIFGDDYLDLFLETSMVPQQARVQEVTPPMRKHPELTPGQFERIFGPERLQEFMDTRRIPLGIKPISSTAVREEWKKPTRVDIERGAVVAAITGENANDVAFELANGLYDNQLYSNRLAQDMQTKNILIMLRSTDKNKNKKQYIAYMEDLAETYGIPYKKSAKLWDWIIDQFKKQQDAEVAFSTFDQMVTEGMERK